MSLSLLSSTGYLKEDEKVMDTEDDINLEEELLKMDNNKEVPTTTHKTKRNAVNEANKTNNK